MRRHQNHNVTADHLQEMGMSELISWLSWNDPNGCYDPEDVWDEFGWVNTREELLAMALEQIADA